MSDLISRDEVLSLLPGGQSCDPQAIADAVRSLSTRQQQGADTTDYKALWKAAELHCAQALRERDEALSRAPQPDTAPLLATRADGTKTLTQAGVDLADAALRASTEHLYDLEVAAPQPDTVTDSAKRLLDEFARFLDVCGEDGKRGRPMDLIDRDDWNRAVLLCAAERPTIEAALAARGK